MKSHSWNELLSTVSRVAFRKCSVCVETCVGNRSINNNSNNSSHVLSVSQAPGSPTVLTLVTYQYLHTWNQVFKVLPKTPGAGAGGTRVHTCFPRATVFVSSCLAPVGTSLWSSYCLLGVQTWKLSLREAKRCSETARRPAAVPCGD